MPPAVHAGASNRPLRSLRETLFWQPGHDTDAARIRSGTQDAAGEEVMKIAIVSPSCVSIPPREDVSPGWVIHDLVEGLAERGHDLTLFGPGDARVSAEVRSVYAQAEWPPSSAAELLHVTAAVKEIRDGGFDLVHVHSPAALACMRFVPGIPLVQTIHHGWNEGLHAYYRHFPRAWFVAEVVTPWAECFPRFAAIPHGLDPERIGLRDGGGEIVRVLRPIDRHARNVLEEAEDDGMVAGARSIARGVAREGVTPEVLRRLADDPSAAVEEVEGDDSDAGLALIAPGVVEGTDRLVLVHAMLSGCPVVALSGNGADDLVEDGVTGFLVGDLAEASELLRPGGPLDGFDRHRCRDRAAERFGQRRMVAEYERLYLRALEEDGANAGLSDKIAAGG